VSDKRWRSRFVEDHITPHTIAITLAGKQVFPTTLHNAQPDYSKDYFFAPNRASFLAFSVERYAKSSADSAFPTPYIQQNVTKV
jgi:hypothetical protein